MLGSWAAHDRLSKQGALGFPDIHIGNRGTQVSTFTKNCSISAAVLRAVRVTPIKVAEAEPVHSP
jgi:hypothetical protein